MTKWQGDVYDDPEALIAAVEAIDDTATIQVVPFRAGAADHFLLIHGGGT